jgi:DNA-binding CsgD family transcriptional regulator
MGGRDPLQLLEAAYSFEGSEEQWLTRIVESLEPYALSRGVLGYVSSLGDEIALRTLVNRSEESSEEARRVVLQPPPFYRRVHAPTPVAFSHDAFAIIAQEFGLDLTQALADQPYRTPDAMWALAGGDANVESVLLVFPCQVGEHFSERDRETLDQLAAHLGSAVRLRSMLRRAPAAEDDSVVAVVSPDGKVLDARGDAKDAAAREPLLDAIRRSEHAKRRKASPEERLEIWTGLVDATWTLLETTERDGKRMFLACRNEPRTRALAALSSREQSVVTYVALGHSFKYIAYELGVSIAHAAKTLETALRKLGLRSRAELIQLLARRSKDELNVSEPPR